jgi:hypothetical protein
MRHRDGRFGIDFDGFTVTPKGSPMHYNTLGHSNLKVSALCLGTMMFGDQTARDEAALILADAHANGINYIDTADVYTKGASEIMVGELLQNQRHDWVLATKLKQWQDYLPALSYTVTDADETLVDSLVHPGHPSTPGFTDPIYPLNGRVRKSAI